uniref:hypothetical protein n=1 Tax=Chloroflexus sp. TaxID=1904827 RepID=UPI002ADDE0DE
SGMVSIVYSDFQDLSSVYEILRIWWGAKERRNRFSITDTGWEADREHLPRTFMRVACCWMIAVFGYIKSGA